MAATHRRLKIKDLVIPEVRMTSVFADDLRATLDGSIKDIGQLMEIIVVETPEGLMVADGKNRIIALKEAGETEVDCAVFQGNRLDVAMFNIVTAKTKGGVKASEMVTLVDMLVNDEGMDSDEICRRTGFTRNYIEQIWKISEGSPLLRDNLDRELIGVGVAFELSRLPNHAQQDEVLSTVHTFSMTTKQAKELVDTTIGYMTEAAAAPAPATAKPEPPPPPKCEICDQPNALLVSVMLDPKCFGQIAHLQNQLALRIIPPVDIEKVEGGA